MGLFDTGSKSVKFANQGDSITGTILRTPREQQSTKFGTTEPDVWPNGDPKMQIVIDLHTTIRQDGDDDGDRTLYVSSTAQKKAIGEAMRAAGANDVEVGGTLTVTFTGFDPQSKNPANPKKLYSASYVKPSSAFAATPAPAPVPTAAPAAAPVGVPGVEADTVNKVKQLINLGIAPEQITAAVGVTAAQIDQIKQAA